MDAQAFHLQLSTFVVFDLSQTKGKLKNPKKQKTVLVFKTISSCLLCLFCGHKKKMVRYAPSSSHLRLPWNQDLSACTSVQARAAGCVNPCDHGSSAARHHFGIKSTREHEKRHSLIQCSCAKISSSALGCERKTLLGGICG